MKKLICILVALMLMTGAACAEVPGSRLGLEALRLLCDGVQNQVVSPVSLTYALAMAAEGADGETQREILSALGVESADDAAGLQSLLTEAGLRQANAAFLPGGMTPRDEYVTALEEKFGAKWFGPEETRLDVINGWVKDATDGMIDGVLSELPAEVRLVLVNAIAMDAAWQSPFDEANTYEEIFHAPQGDVSVQMMHKTLRTTCGEREGVQLLRLGYRDCGLSMLIALPEDGGVEAVLDGLCAEGLEYFRFEEGTVEVELSMPRTDVAVTNGLNDALQALGIETAFSDGADLSGVSADVPLKLGSAVQRARVILDEEGTKAAAVTAMSVATCAMVEPVPPVEFKMDRPFAFVIADEASGAICFAGIVANPSGN